MEKLTHSTEIGHLALAVAAVQRVVQPALKDKTAEAGKFAYDYADLESVWATCREALSTNGLAVFQPPAAEGARVVLTTLLVHGESGQWMRSELEMIAQGGNAQAIGSAISYARRYSLMGMLGLVAKDEDDDGQKSQERPAPTTRAPVEAPRPLTYDEIVAKLEEASSTKTVMAVVKRWVDPEAGANADHPLKVAARARYKVLKEQESAGGAA